MAKHHQQTVHNECGEQVVFLKMSTDSFENVAYSAATNNTPAPRQPRVSQTDCDNYDPKSYVANQSITVSAFWLGTSTIILNLLVIFFMGWSLKKARSQNIPKLLVVLLAVTDCSLGAFSIEVQAFRYLWGYCGTGGHTVCVMQAFALNVIIVSSSLIVVLMSTERFCALRLPFRYNTIFTMQHTFMILAGILFYSVILAILPLSGVNKYALGGFGCDFDWRDTTTGGIAYNYYFGFQGLILMPIIVGLNISVLREINRMTSVAPAVIPGSQKNTSEQDAGSSQLQRRFAVLTLLASAAFIICNTPILVRLIQYQRHTVDQTIPDFVIKRLHISNSLINPCLSLFFYLSNLKWKVMCGCQKTEA